MSLSTKLSILKHYLHEPLLYFLSDFYFTNEMQSVSLILMDGFLVSFRCFRMCWVSPEKQCYLCLFSELKNYYYQPKLQPWILYLFTSLTSSTNPWYFKNCGSTTDYSLKEVWEYVKLLSDRDPVFLTATETLPDSLSAT